MDKRLLELLEDPVGGKPFSLESRQANAGELIDGVLRSATHAYPIRQGVPRFVLATDEKQEQTENSFGFKWAQQHSYDSPSMHRVSQEWLCSRYGFQNPKEMQAHLSRSRWILDAGCGGGFSASLWMDPDWRGSGQAQWVGVDISSAIDVARERLGRIPGTSFVQADLLQLPFKDHAFDFIYSEGVLHHTPSTEKALRSLLRVLAPGGEIIFYVYRKKGPVREFTDDYIRKQIADLPPQAAWERLLPLTRLGQALAAMRAEVKVVEDVPDLGIQAGTYDIQRFLYWNFAKLFWNHAYTFDENHHVNFDWYHPAYAHRHTEDEVRGWCRDAGLEILRFDAQESGFTVRARRG